MMDRRSQMGPSLISDISILLKGGLSTLDSKLQALPMIFDFQSIQKMGYNFCMYRLFFSLNGCVADCREVSFLTCVF